MAADGSSSRILIVDDDESFLSAASDIARLQDCAVDTATSVTAARGRLKMGQYDLVLLDLALPDGNGLDLLDDVDLAQPIQMAVITGCPSVETAVRAMHVSVLDYLVKPLDHSMFQSLLDRATQNSKARMAPEPVTETASAQLIGESAAISEVRNEIRRVAPLDVTVLIHGESGTGKELAARALHELSGRSGAFIAVNCGAVSPELLASQLFGHERGSFTGAVKQHAGFFEQAQGGTLLLDEVTEMPLQLQAHLLRVLETRTITRVGGIREQNIDVRLLAATNRDPWSAVADGRLRQDLYYRLLDFPMHLPALRERPADTMIIAQRFLDRLNARYRTDRKFAEGTEERMRAYAWPGNVRELKNVVQRAYILAEDQVTIDLPSIDPASYTADQSSSVRFHVGMTFEEIERQMLIKTLAYYNNDKPKAAQTLGISLKTIYNRLARFAPAAVPVSSEIAP